MPNDALNCEGVRSRSGSEWRFQYIGNILKSGQLRTIRVDNTVDLAHNEVVADSGRLSTEGENIMEADLVALYNDAETALAKYGNDTTAVAGDQTKISLAQAQLT